jgi:hypothetical protein
MVINKREKHCIKALKVFDWVNRILDIRLKESINVKKEKKFDDLLCCDFKVPCNSKEPSTIWNGLGIENISGTLNIAFHCGCGGVMDVIVNGKKMTSLVEGESFCATISDLQSIEVLCHSQSGQLGFCEGELKLVLHFKHKDSCIDLKEIKKIKCFLSDSCGNRLDPTAPGSIICEELPQENGRKNIDVMLPNGKSVILQKVNVLKQGFVTVEFFNQKGDICKKCTFPFSEIETFFLCAPPGTTLDCEIISFDCEAHIIPPLDKDAECLEIVISISICQSVQIVGEVKIEVEGDFCESRRDIEINEICPTSMTPPQCPFIFT